ncbi:hypothetical protein CLV58_101202 [Spirosoma oryzae]|uniref:Uncharacterized protein n=1 Tax=Spirosoma oryzae TaxID=1469603 RepID=A0A2T0TN99_9BACT|nr:hypothetical protein [Spirosoma oryzae]PRY47136.1 hypothetical protein CLV58_101202 [Spirosoma oryzae]
MKEIIHTLRTSLKFGGKLSTILDLGFVHGVYNKMMQEAIAKHLKAVIDRAEEADKLEKENKELRAQLAQTMLF